MCNGLLKIIWINNHLTKDAKIKRLVVLGLWGNKEGHGGNDKKEIEMAEILQGRMGDY